ncbi:DsrH like protein [Acinetobacter calcoaceticus]|uniref:DsrH like protein n=1 Tax=Acinetobacter calcoaceticus TaxID=471 RepID=UPI0018FFF0A8|nr:DsrH like protein [Acinetobacter calcoaceticus]MBJ9720288.1 DsrH like protein [Acinetobacter calcoaceticus]
MNPSTLYLVQSSYHSTPKIIDELRDLFQAGDQIVFMGDSVAQISSTLLLEFNAISCLVLEKDLLDANLLDQMNILNYEQFTDLVLAFNRCISLK